MSYRLVMRLPALLLFCFAMLLCVATGWATEAEMVSRLEYLATNGYQADSGLKYPEYIPGDST